MTYELWDRRNRNCLGSFDARAEAFQAVLAIVDDQPDLLADLELDGEDAEGRQVLKLAADELGDLARLQPA